MNKIILQEIKDIADTVALVALCGGDSSGQLRAEMSRLGATYGLDEQTLAGAKKQLMTRLNQQYNIRGL